MSSKVKNSGKKNYGYLGPPGTFSEMAALKYTDSCDKIIPYKTIREVVEKVNKGEIKRGIIPLENSQEGSVNVSLDLLLNKSNLKIIGEVIIPIEHYLMAPPDIKLKDIEEIYSHPQAIAQSRDFIYQHLPEVNINFTDSTALAADKVVNNGKKAMIGSRRVNELYNLEILAENVEGNLENYTRFIVIALKEDKISFDNNLKNDDYKTSIVCTPQINRPGILHEILGEFANRSIDLTRIESRPTKKKLGEYLFYIDLEGKDESAEISDALNKVKKKCRVFKILGSYPQDKNRKET
ncbi:MAG: prephenate dehydratase [Bacillota bacterium]